MTRTLHPLLPKVGILIVLIAFGSSTVWGQGNRIRDRIPPTAPTNLVVTATTPQSVSLAWGPSTDNSGSFNYVICCGKGTVTVGQTVTSHTLEGLASGATYVIRVYARDGAGNLSSPSNAVTVTLPGDAAPTKPVVTVQDVGPTHVSLTWRSTDNGSIWYTIFLDGQAILTTNSTSGIIAPLEQETTYTITVQARDAQGNLSPVSDAVVVTTDPPNPNDHTPPTPPTNVTADGNIGDVVVRWNASIDDFTPQSLIRYNVYLNGELSTVVVGNPSAVVHLDIGVNVITVIAVDEADNESQPGTVTVIS